MEKLDADSIISSSFAEVALRYSSRADRAPVSNVVTPAKAWEVFMSIWNKDTLELREEFYVLLLNNAKQLIGWSNVSIGGKTATVVEISQLVTLALLSNACSMVVAHNHPSGRLRPSEQDIRLTNKLASALYLHDLKLDDHLIVTREDYYSFRMNDKIDVQPLFL